MKQLLILLLFIPGLAFAQQIKPISGVPHEVREAGNVTFVTQLHYHGLERIFPVGGTTVVYKGELSYADVVSSGVVGEGVIGFTEVFGSSTLVANRRAVPVTAVEDGEIKSISIYHNGGSGGLLLGVYSDASGSPDSRLGVTSEATVSSSEGWQTINLISPVSITAGQKVWLAWVFENNPGIRYTTGTTPRAESSSTWSGGMPVSFGTASYDNYDYSIYCTYIPEGVPTKTWGHTEVFDETTTWGNRRAVPVTASEAGEIESITIYHNGGSGGLLLGVYSDASGSPASRLGVTSEVIVLRCQII